MTAPSLTTRFEVGVDSSVLPLSQGASVVERTLGAFHVVESVHPPRLSLTRHRHERPTITIVLAGEFVEILPDGPKLCEPGTVLAKPAGVPHSNWYGRRGARCLIVEVHDDRRFADGRCGAPAPDRVVFCAHGAVSRLAGRIARAAADRDDAGWLTVESLLYQVRAFSTARTPPMHCSSIQRAVEYLHAAYSRPVRMADVAGAAGVHPTYLARAFGRHFRRTPGDLLRELRVNWAAHLLQETESALSHVALSSGFADQSHLTRVFKARMGTTPARYRRAHRMR